jgi:hypothetical protein
MKTPRIEASHSIRTYPHWMNHVLTEPLSARELMLEAPAVAENLWRQMPTLVIDPTIKAGKLPTWTHMVYAIGPTDTDGKHGTELCIIWWSEFSPDSERVLDAIDWDKHAQDFTY